ncbi:MAG: AMP-dependent synthetase/ligase [Candidatus Ancillula sp.]|jgi:long-chain acyl-CoA synthetase|nr:AMP-dependent synthetase/ligase [Candidatus Ancillula sp.]
MISNLYSLLDSRIERLSTALFEYKDSKNTWKSVSPSDFKLDVDKIAAGLLSLGVKKGESVAIISPTSYEWVCLDFAILSIGAVVVPVYETSSPAQIKHILTDSNSKYAFVWDSAIFEHVDSISDQVPELINTYVLDRGALEYIKSLGEKVEADALLEVQNSVESHELATIVYTSGSTGAPKGVELSHKNFLSITESGLESVPELLMRENARLLLFLPLAHVFARFLGYVAVAGTTTMGIVSNVSTLLKDLDHFKPTYLLGVPRIFEKVYNASSQKAGIGIKGKLFKDAAKVAVEVSKLMQDGKQVPAGIKAKHALYTKLVYSKILHALGGACEYAVSGGAGINPELAHFFTGAGLPILEGYGLTETAAPALVNRVGANKIGSIGLPLEGVEVRIDDDGEVLIKSDSLMMGYRNLPEETANTMENDWLKTGDLGVMHESGHVSITGRKKDLIVTAGGKNVSPTPLEEAISANPIISACVIVGENRPFIGALITLDTDNLRHFLKTHSLDASIPITEARDLPLVKAEIDHSIAKANRLVSKAESIRKYTVLEEDFTEANGQLTPSMKVRRQEVVRINADIIEREIYRRR